MLNKIFYSALVCLLLTCGSSLAQQARMEIIGTDTIYHDIQADEEEIAILKELFENTGGNRWKKNDQWLTNYDFSKWFGIVTEYGDVVEIHLDNNNLKGAIPKSVYKLLRLRHASFAGNNLSDHMSKKSPSAKSISSLESFSQLTGSSSNAYGKNLPVWGLAVTGSIQRVDWRDQPPTVQNLVTQSGQTPAASGVGVDDCGRLAFYALHTGTDALRQLHLYAADGTLLTTSSTALSSVQGNNEIQVVRVPGRSDEWYIIYSLWYTKNCGTSPQSSIYCPAQVVYTRIKYESATKTLTFLPNQREVRIGSVFTDTYIQGKAVSRTVDGDPTRHYLYLASRTNTSQTTRIHRFIIDANGIAFEGASQRDIAVGYWVGTIAGSTIELSPDEQMLAVNNRNVGAHITQDIILFDLTNFNSSTYSPTIISALELIVFDTGGKTFRELGATTGNACLLNVKHKLNGIQFSPSGQYLYITHGGYPPSSGGRTYNTYLLQVDLASATSPGGNDFTTRVQVQQGVGTTPTACLGGSFTSADHAMSQIESAFDGRIYFTKAYSNELFVIPNPDDPMPHSLTPGTINLAAAGAPNITLTPAGSYVTFMPENIDGYDYLSESTAANFALVPEAISVGGSVNLNITGFSSSNRYQVSWGDGTLEPLTTATRTHTYPQAGDYEVRLSLTNPEGCTTLTSKTLTVGACSIPGSVSISNVTNICAVKFSTEKLTDCLVNYSWNFGDGATSIERNPIHVYASSGTYNVTLTATYDCQSCQGSVTASKSVVYTAPAPELVTKTIQVVSDIKANILSSGVTTFSDTWPLNHANSALDLKNGYANGSQGVWRNQASYIYRRDRLMSPDIDISKDGTHFFRRFNFKYAELNAVPEWFKANTVTRYSPYSFELENQDILGIYSAAVYDYGGQLPSANGINMRNDEMAFTSFETIDGPVAGNWILSVNAIPEYTQFIISSADKNMAIVEASLSQLQNVTTVDVLAATRPGDVQNPANLFQGNEIVCVRAHPNNALWTIVVLKTAPIEDYWYGILRIKNIANPAVTSVFDNVVAHSGKQSLKITSTQTFKQDLLNLDVGKSYWINGWVSVNNAYVTTPVLGSGLGIDIIARQKNGQEISTFQFSPAGVVIEGWQQLKGSFICPANTAYIEVRFKPGTGGAWYDDLRLQPEDGNMKGYVYNLTDYRLQAVLDEENFASYFFYDREGNLYLTKKETTDGIKTLSENVSYQVER